MARDQARCRSPGDRPPCGKEVCEASVPAGSGRVILGGEKNIPDGPLLRQEREEKTRNYGLLSAEKGVEWRLSVPWGFMGREGAPLEAAGGKEAAFLTGEQRAGRWAGGGGLLRFSPRSLAPSGLVERLSEALP